MKMDNKELFNALGSILDARGIQIEYVDGNAYVGECFNSGEKCLYVRPENGATFNALSPKQIDTMFDVINIDGYRFRYKEFLPYYSEDGIISPELIIFSVKEVMDEAHQLDMVLNNMVD